MKYLYSNSLIKKIVKECGEPIAFSFEYIDGASVMSDIRRMKEYISCVNKVMRIEKMKHRPKTKPKKAWHLKIGRKHEKPGEEKDYWNYRFEGRPKWAP